MSNHLICPPDNATYIRAMVCTPGIPGYVCTPDIRAMVCTPDIPGYSVYSGYLLRGCFRVSLTVYSGFPYK